MVGVVGGAGGVTGWLAGGWTGGREVPGAVDVELAEGLREVRELLGDGLGDSGAAVDGPGGVAEGLGESLAVPRLRSPA